MVVETKNAIQWISDNIDGENNLSPEILQEISDFSLMWSLFEASEINGANNFTDEISNIARRVCMKITLAETDDILKYWKNRYIKDGIVDNSFDYLINHGSRDNGNIPLLLDVLLEKKETLQEKVEAIIIITYRLRNNLFHGNKNLMRLGNQIENLKCAINGLKLMLKCSGRFRFMGVEV